MGATALRVHVNASGGGGGRGVAYIWRGDLNTKMLLLRSDRRERAAT